MSRPRKKDLHLPANVHFKHGRHWYVKGGTWTPLARDLPTALAEYAALVAAPIGGMPDLIRRALAQILPGLAASTVSQYKTAARDLAAVFAEFSPQQVKPKHIAALKVHGADHPNMTNRKISLLRQVFQYAVEWQEVESNPCIGVRRHVEKRRDRYLTDAEWSAIRTHAHPRLAAIMQLQYLTGQRIMDVARLHRSAISEDGILFRQQKTKAQVLVRMSPELRAALDVAQRVDGEHVRGLSLFHIRGRAPSYGGIRDLWRAAAARAGVLDARPNDTRAKSLTDADAQGHNAQRLGGHTTPAMTARYIRHRQAPVASGPSFGQSNRQTGKKA